MSSAAEREVRDEEEFGLELVQYAGRWVAVENRTVLDYDKELGCLLERLNGERRTAEIFQVEPAPASLSQAGPARCHAALPLHSRI
jgi:hypothetical protein